MNKQEEIQERRVIYMDYKRWKKLTKEAKRRRSSRSGLIRSLIERLR